MKTINQLLAEAKVDQMNQVNGAESKVIAELELNTSAEHLQKLTVVLNRAHLLLIENFRTKCGEKRGALYLLELENMSMYMMINLIVRHQ